MVVNETLVEELDTIGMDMGIDMVIVERVDVLWADTHAAAAATTAMRVVFMVELELSGRYE